MRALRAAVALLLALAVVRQASAGSLGDFTEGTAVPYGGPQDGQDPHIASGGLVSGSCGYGQLSQQEWPHWAAVAVSPTSFLPSNSTRHPLLGCGACLELVCDPRPGFEGRCPANFDGSSVIALVTDTCKDCPPTKVTLHYLAFQQKLANADQGEVGIKFRLVECPAPGNIVADIDTYRAAAGGYIRLSLENVAGSGALESIELRKSPMAGDRLSLAGTSWTRMTNSWGSKWELSGLPEPPLDMRITSDNGEELVARQAITQAGGTGKQALAVQFSTAGAPAKGEALPDNTRLTGTALLGELQKSVLPASGDSQPNTTSTPAASAAAAAASPVPGLPAGVGAWQAGTASIAPLTKP